MCVVTGKMKGADVEARPVASTQGWIVCLSARAHSTLLGEMTLLPQGLNGTLARAMGTEFLPRRCHFGPDFKKAVEVQGSFPCTISDQLLPGSMWSSSIFRKAKFKRLVAVYHTLFVVTRTLSSYSISRLN